MNSEDTVSEICSSHGGGGGDGDSQCGHSQKRPQVVDDHDDDDNTDVAVIEKPPNFVPRPRKKARSVVGELNNECCILDSSPYKTVAVSEISVNDSDELIVTAENGQVACRDYPHSRDCCVKFPFESTPHEKHCALVTRPVPYWCNSKTHPRNSCHFPSHSPIWVSNHKLLECQAWPAMLKFAFALQS